MENTELYREANQIVQKSPYLKIHIWHCFQCAFSVLSGQGSLTTDSHERESAECLFALLSNQKGQCDINITLKA